MLLDRIDIDAHGPLNCVELGPFAEHLNVVSSPDGSGKTAIIRFVRDSLVNRDYPLGMMSSSTGRVVWADRHGLLHCRREKDGTATGRRTVEFESRGDLTGTQHAYGSTWAHHVANAGTSDSMLAIQSIQLPESLVDGVITDTGVTSVARVVSACVRSGLDSPETYRSLPLGRDSVYRDRSTAPDSVAGHRRDMAGDRRYEEKQHLREELASVESELARLGERGHERESLVARRAELAARLARPTAATFDHFIPRSRYTQWQHELNRLHDRARQLRYRQSELRRWIANIDADLARYNYPAAAESTSFGSHAAVSDENLRRQLDDLDSQMIRWRRALLEVRGLRQALLAGRETWARYAGGPIDETTLRRMRLDGFLHAIDHYEPSRGWDDHYQNAYASTYRPLVHLDEVEARIDSATRNIDWLLSRYADPSAVQHAWFESIPASASYRSSQYHPSDAAFPQSLGETLRAIREDLRGVRRYTSGAAAVSGTLSETYPAAESNLGELEELRHSESWLVAAIEGLSRHRHSLLSQDPTSRDPRWLPRSEPSGYDVNYPASASSNYSRLNLPGMRFERNERSGELDRVTHELNQCLNSAAEIRRSMRTLPVIDSLAAHDHVSYPGASSYFGFAAGDSIDGYSASPADGYHSDWIDRDAIVAEIQAIDARLSSTSRVQWLRERRQRLQDQLRVDTGPVRSQSPLSDAASSWLVRLSAGRLRRVDWPYQLFRAPSANPHRDGSLATGVVINGQDESRCSGADRSLAVMAVRLAAGELLSELGRPVPLIFETHRELFQDDLVQHRSAFGEHGDHGRSNHPIAAALADYAHRGRQVITFTSHQGLAEQLTRVGARTFAVHGQRTVHPHRPLWRPQYETETYVGPHPHTYGDRMADEVRPAGPWVSDRDTFSDRDTVAGRGFVSPSMHPEGVARYATSGANRTYDINRDFDMAWREAYGFYDNPDRTGSDRANPDRPYQGSVRTDQAVDGAGYRDGYYFADQFTTSPVVRPEGRYRDAAPVSNDPATLATGPLVAGGQIVKQVAAPESPFFLSVDSPIDQAPSIDAVAAARLRGLSVTHINHLMQQDSNRLADALGLANVDAATIRRWQAECRLACRVPQLRGFDARVLVGCGITTPAQLAAIHPIDLLGRVEQFLATECGQQLLLSGSSHELSRLTSWIAAANSNHDRQFDGFGRGRVATRRANGSPRHRRSMAADRSGQYLDADLDDADDLRGDYEFDSDRYEYEDADGRAVRSGGRRRRVIRTIDGTAEHLADEYSRRRTRNGAGSAASDRDDSNQRIYPVAGSSGGGGNRGGNGSGNGSGRGKGYGSGTGSGSGSGSAGGSGTGRPNTGRSGRSQSRRSNSGRSGSDSVQREVVRYEQAEREPRSQRAPQTGRGYERSARESESREASRRESGRRRVREEREDRRSNDGGDENELRFYLQRDSDIVDAPSIGARMAERLNQIGLYTVDDLLNSDPETVAEQLGHRRVDADTVLQWQQQSTLVCRVPMLRGHDAQFLVMAEVTTPEELAGQDADDLFGIVDVIARSSDGKRVARGSKLPDLEEVTEWIGYAQHHRELKAA
ncbi:hypothetical protein K227x_51550 [Rubripirellula lacrimiformis]|uniref:DUF4332 domain-containing protein n=1 Tax=Rubripirellula lacrimiformis TaxID=1930273 RepID=A0A517NHX5_9BACT|nr:DUF4332 domain-containing protein [Rubripirellula lacrimiformis]QDT06739.1 hypothetical protein K227x_51550 [Rubripirellula lacrimiformis]